MDSRKPKSCLGCPLDELGTGFLRPEGRGSNGVIIIGEAAGKHEAKDSLPFRPHAPAGGLLQRLFQISGVKRNDFTIYNVVACQPVGNELVGMPYEAETIAHCRQHLDTVVEQSKPRVILALGGSAFKALTANPTANISEGRGYLYDSVYGIPLIPSYHPAFLLRGSEYLLGVSQHDLRRAVQVARRPPTPIKPHYILSPTTADIRNYLNRLTAPNAIAAHDLETENILGRKTEAIIQVQFSSGVGEALVLQWPRHVEAIKAVFETEAEKWGYNDRLFDRPILKRNGVILNGPLHDLINVYSHLQPNFVSSKDDTHGDKGVPSRLMSLQSCLSFYYPEFRTWKHPYLPPFDACWMDQPLPLPLRYYGAKDVDATYRVGVKMFEALRRGGLEFGYLQHKWRLGAVLDDLSVRGLPVDGQKQAELREFIIAEETQLEAELQRLVPAEVCPTTKPYKALPKDLRAELKQRGLIVPKAKLDYYVEHHYDICTSLNYCNRVDWIGDYHLVRVLPFNPNSSQQLLRYIEYRGYRIPLDIDTRKPTTGKDAIDQLIAETSDDVLRNTRQLRRLTKIKGTYTEGHWVPQSDGRVHPEWSFGTVSGQLTPRKPNAAQFPAHGALAKKAKACIRAEDGHTFIKRDMRSFHARSLSWVSGDEAYWTLSDEDVHSYVASHFLRLPIANELLKMSAADRRRELARIKVEHADVRNLQAKRAILGLGFHMGVDKLFRMNPDAFGSPLEAQALIELIQSLFPKAFVEYPKTIERRIRKFPRLVSPIGHQRWAWAQDLEQAVSFEPANIAHGHMFDSMLIMQERGLNDRWQLCNMIHDCLIFHCPNELIDECVEGSREIMERESEVLTDSPLGRPFQCSSDVEIGTTMAEMKAL